MKHACKAQLLHQQPVIAPAEPPQAPYAQQTTFLFKEAHVCCLHHQCAASKSERGL